MSTGAKIGIAIAVAAAIWFAWIAVELRQAPTASERAVPRTSTVRDPTGQGSAGATGGRGMASAPSGERRPIDRSGNGSRDDFSLERRAERQSDRRLAEAREQRGRREDALVEQLDAPEPGAGSPADERRGAAPKAAREGSGDTAGGTGESVDGAERQRPARFVPGPGDLKPDAKLAGADLSGAQLDGKDLQGADLSAADLHGATMTDTDLTDAILAEANLSKVNLQRGSLVAADLHQARLDGADLRGAELEGAILTDTSMTGANVAGVTFAGADLAGANLRGAMLFGVDLRDTNLENADFENADLRDANLTGVDLSNALNLTCAQISVARGWQSAALPEDLACSPR